MVQFRSWSEVLTSKPDLTLPPPDLDLSLTICKQGRQGYWVGRDVLLISGHKSIHHIETFYIVFSCQNFKFTRCFIVLDICGLSLNAPSPTNSQPQPGTIIKVAKFKTDLKLPRVKFCNENYILFLFAAQESI